MILVVIGAARSQAGIRVGINTRPEYYQDSWRDAVQRREHFNDNLGYIAAAGLVPIDAAGAIFQNFRSGVSTLARASSTGLFAVGILILIMVWASFRLSDLAHECADESGAAPGQIASSAFALVTARLWAAFFGLPYSLQAFWPG